MHIVKLDLKNCVQKRLDNTFDNYGKNGTQQI